MTLEPERRIYRMWNRGREVNTVWNDEIDFPTDDTGRYVIPQIGVVHEISYWSDKFARECVDCGKITEDKKCPDCGAKTNDAPGVFELYTHDCDSHAPIYANTSRNDGDAELVIEPWSGRKGVTFLVYMADLTLKTNNGKKVTQGFTFSQNGTCTPMYALPDRKTLMINWKKRPMIITGSKMRVTAHGLVR